MIVGHASLLRLRPKMADDHTQFLDPFSPSSPPCSSCGLAEIYLGNLSVNVGLFQLNS